MNLHIPALNQLSRIAPSINQKTKAYCVWRKRISCVTPLLSKLNESIRHNVILGRWYNLENRSLGAVDPPSNFPIYSNHVSLVNLSLVEGIDLGCTCEIYFCGLMHDEDGPMSTSHVGPWEPNLLLIALCQKELVRQYSWQAPHSQTADGDV